MDEDEGLRRYIQSLPPRLSADEEVRLLGMGEVGQRELIERSLRLVVYVATQYIGRGLPLDDLIQEGNLVLLKAVPKRPLDWRGRLSTWLVICLRRGMQRAIIDHAQAVQLPFHQAVRRRDLRQMNDADLCPAEREELAVLDRAIAAPVSLDAPFPGDSEPLYLADLLADEGENTEDVVERQETIAMVQEAVATLPARTRWVLAYRFGRDLSLMQTARRLSCSDVTVLRHERAGMQRLRALIAH